jgi:hypothetical protein
MSGIVIPLGITAASGGGVGTGITLGTASSKQAVVRAVAAAVAVKDPGKSLETAKLAREDPGKVIGDVNEIAVKEIILAVEAARENPSDAKPPNDIVAAARIAGADAKLAYAAFGKLSVDAVKTAGINWVAALDGPLLERTARATAKEHLLGLLSDKQRIASLEDTVKDLKQRVEALEAKTGGTGGGGTGGTTPAGGTTPGGTTTGGTGAGSSTTGGGASYTSTKGPGQNP